MTARVLPFSMPDLRCRETCAVQEGTAQQEILREGSGMLRTLERALERWELQRLLGGDYDAGPALLSIQVPGLTASPGHVTLAPEVQQCQGAGIFSPCKKPCMLSGKSGMHVSLSALEACGAHLQLEKHQRKGLLKICC